MTPRQAIHFSVVLPILAVAGSGGYGLPCIDRSGVLEQVARTDPQIARIQTVFPDAETTLEWTNVSRVKGKAEMAWVFAATVDLPGACRLWIVRHVAIRTDGKTVQDLRNPEAMVVAKDVSPHDHAMDGSQCKLPPDAVDALPVSIFPRCMDVEAPGIDNAMPRRK